MRKRKAVKKKRGRPPLYGERMRLWTGHVPERLHQEFGQLSTSLGRSRADLVREAMQDFVDKMNGRKPGFERRLREGARRLLRRGRARKILRLAERFCLTSDEADRIIPIEVKGKPRPGGKGKEWWALTTDPDSAAGASQ